MDDGLGGENPHGFWWSTMAMWKMMCITEIICFFKDRSWIFAGNLKGLAPAVNSLLSIRHVNSDQHLFSKVFRLSTNQWLQWSQESSAEAMMATTSPSRPTSWPLAWCWEPQSPASNERLPFASYFWVAPFKIMMVPLYLSTLFPLYFHHVPTRCGWASHDLPVRFPSSFHMTSHYSNEMGGLYPARWSPPQTIAKLTQITYG